ncbi:hypothetical protein, partial [Corynebacterium glyciniphilum]|uniref:hypothetical protein n=1 Tax=Corynebacterium glyciniphilum TaxID=1404244 RepID=UPI003FD3248D
TRTAEALCERDEAREKLADKLDEVAQLHTEVERLTGESAARFDHIEVLEKRVERMVATGSTYPSDALPDLPEP